MTDLDTKQKIETALKSFSSGNPSKSTLALFTALGYNTSRQNPFVKKTTAEFEDHFGHAFAEKKFSKEKARFNEWKTVDLLFQLSREELSGQQGLFDSHKINWEGEDERKVIETYLFFAIELTLPEYSRTELAQITREVNKIFPMPVMIVFKHGKALTISIIDRRLHKRDAQKDVLKKVTLIKDIAIESPHRAHIEILFDLSLDELKRIHKFTNFVELHHAWQKTLDTKELNKRFYHELANWYFWAIKNVSFPNDVPDDKDDTVFNSESVIRLLTRLIFIWFIKEKHLIPEIIFDEKELKGMVKNFNIAGSTVYYRAILQNLFFATLNKKIEERAFATDGTFEQNKKNYGIKNLYRYSSDFNISKEAVMKMFAGVPFLNGGLFDCLDYEDEKGKVLYLDGFSRNPKKQAQVPDKLFFAREHTIDLSDVYDDKKKKNEKVKGLFEIFNHYKFTITENTPIEEEVALDPELLGRVFENLLASYNPETQTTARKQTGSFYTPREIVNYMVDESLKAYLKQKLESEAGMKPQDADAGLEILFAYTEKEHAFTERETNILIDAIDNCKILDPACGSGAFPMGILHKLAHILHKLDPQNEKWKERQIAKARQIDDPNIREQAVADIEAAFANNELDYGRKLYLIENCIYGVDIQPIAIQISKLRFFISLIVDQKVDKRRDNFGVRPLPNLETKFVAANTLIGLDKPQTGGQTSFENPEVKKLEDDLKYLRHQYFNARTRTQKRFCQEKDKELRKKIAELLIKDGWNKDAARSVASFDPYNQNASSPFFDSEWMFGITDGFDVVIGNPPYIEISGISVEKRNIYKGLFKTATGRFDLYLLFIEKTMQLKNREGGFVFIIPGKFLNNKQFASTRKLISQSHNITVVKIDDKVFDTSVDSAIIQNHFINNPAEAKYRTFKISGQEVTLQSETSVTQILENPEVIFRIELNDKTEILISKICYGTKRFIEIGEVKDGIIAGLLKDLLFVSKKTSKDCKPLYFGKQISRYHLQETNTYIDYRPDFALKEESKRKHGGAPGLRMREKRIFERKKIIYRKVGKEIIATFDNTGVYYEQTVHSACVTDTSVRSKYILGLFNSMLLKFYYHKTNSQGGNIFPQIRISSVENLPIKIVDQSTQERIELLVDYVLVLKKQNRDTAFFERLIDAMVYELYFPDEIKAADAEVLKHLAGLSELKDNWSDKKKLEVIEKVYKELSTPTHPISIAMFKMDTIEEIRIIEGKQ